MKGKPGKTIGLKYAQAYVPTAVKDDVSHIKLEHDSQADPRESMRLENSQSASNNCCKSCFWGGVSKCNAIMKQCSTSWDKCSFNPVPNSLFCHGFRFIIRKEHTQCKSMSRRKVKWTGLRKVFKEELQKQKYRPRRPGFDNTALSALTDSDIVVSDAEEELAQNPGPSFVEVYEVERKYRDVIRSALERMKRYPGYFGNRWPWGNREHIRFYL